MAEAVKLAFAVLMLCIVAGCASSLQGVGEQKVPQSTVLVTGDYVIPEAFFGCWEGTLERFDSVTPSLAGYFTYAAHTTYRFCFRRRPDGTGRLDLTKVEIEGKPVTVTRFDNHITGADPKRLMARLRNHTVAESVAHLFWIYPIHIQQDIVADELLTMKNRDLIFVEGQQVLRVNGGEAMTMTFHADFHRVDDGNQMVRQ